MAAKLSFMCLMKMISPICMFLFIILAISRLLTIGIRGKVVLQDKVKATSTSPLLYVPSIERCAQADSREAGFDARELAVALAGRGFGHGEGRRR